MAFDPIPKEVRKVWDTWNLRGFIILSLSLQTTLIFCGPLRKRTSNMFMIFIIWSAYLLADWVATFAVGSIFNSQGENSEPADNGDLLAFWAAFLLVHLGGPDTITAFAIEDNALWPWHLIGLVFQVFAAFYVFLQTLPDNKLLAPTILMLLAEIIKYAERIQALYLASLDRFKESMLREPDAGPNYAKLMDEYASKKEAKIPNRVDYIPEPKKDNIRTTAFNGVELKLHEEDAVKYAYQFFEIFKGLIVNLIFSFPERNESRTFFQGRTPDDAYKVILIELNFMYEALYTKVIVVHALIGYIFRFLAFGLTISALVIFNQLTKGRFHEFDVRITYTLLIAAIALDSIAMFMVFFSDWNVANINNLAKRYRSFGGAVDRCLTPILKRFLRRTAPQTSEVIVQGKFKYDVMDTPVLYRRWAESMSAYNLIGFCIKVQPETIGKQLGWFRFTVKIIVTAITFPFLVIWKLLNYIKLLFVRVDQCCGWQYGFVWFFGGIFMFVFDNLGLTQIYEEMTYVSKNAFIKKLWDFIFRELVDKSHLPDDPETARMICEARGEWVLQDSSLGLTDRAKETLVDYVSNVEYDQSILLWHIAMDHCYYTEDEDSLKRRNDYRVCSKLLSDYMLHLLVMQPKMMYAVVRMWQIRFRDTCAEAEKLFDQRGLKYEIKKTDKQKLKWACERVLQVNTDVKPIAVKGERSKSVLFDACILAKELNELERQGKDRWEVMCKVWVELLSYAASHCRGDTHAEVLSKGGELVTLFWLLMAQLGIGEQFELTGQRVKANLKVNE